jgi:hypothetical protein
MKNLITSLFLPLLLSMNIVFATETLTADRNPNLNLNTNAVTLLVEDFETAQHNQNLVLPNWTNQIISGSRPFWGFNLIESANDTNRVAKTTLYRFGVSTPEDWEMWLITPALNAVNAASKIFSFKLMGDFLSSAKATTPQFEIYYIEKDSEGIYAENLQIPVPTTSEEEKLWRSYYVDFANAGNVADTFWIGFRMYGSSYNGSVATYYLDSVTFGYHTAMPTAIVEPKISKNQLVMWQDANILYLSVKDIQEISIVDVFGKEIECYFTAGNEYSLPIGHLKKGFYIAKIKTKSGISIGKFVKTN